jgi:hypothetical protein
MYRIICGVAAAGALLAPSHADGQIWKRLRGGTDSAAKTAAAPAVVSDQEFAAQMAAGHVVLSGVQFGDDGRLDSASGAQMTRLADALKHAKGRYRVDAFVDAGTDTAGARMVSAIYANVVRVMLVTRGVPAAALPGAPISAAAMAAAQSSAAGAAGQVPTGSVQQMGMAAAGSRAGGMMSGLAGGMAGSVAGAMGGSGDSSHTGMSSGDVAKAAAENLIPGAKLAKMGFGALKNRGAAQAHADSVARGLAPAAKPTADTSQAGTSSADMAKAAATDLIPGAKLAKLGFGALRNRGAAQARADSTARLRVARIEIVKIG